MANLKEWAEKHKTYLKLEENVPVSCRFLGFEPFVDKENEDKDKIRYFLEVSGNKKVLESQSIVLAEEMAKAKEGDWVEISRTGKGRNTRYEVKVLPTPDEEITEEDLEEVEKGAKKK